MRNSPKTVLTSQLANVVINELSWKPKRGLLDEKLCGDFAAFWTKFKDFAQEYLNSYSNADSGEKITADAFAKRMTGLCIEFAQDKSDVRFKSLYGENDYFRMYTNAQADLLAQKCVDEVFKQNQASDLRGYDDGFELTRSNYLFVEMTRLLENDDFKSIFISDIIKSVGKNLLTGNEGFCKKTIDDSLNELRNWASSEDKFTIKELKFQLSEAITYSSNYLICKTAANKISELAIDGLMVEATSQTNVRAKHYYDSIEKDGKEDSRDR